MSDAARLIYATGEGLSLPDGAISLIRPVATPEWHDIPNPLQCVQSFKTDCDALTAMGLAVGEPVADAAAAMVCLTRSREESFANIASAWSGLPAGGLLIVSGEKKQGADAVFKAVRKFAEVDGSISKAHGRLFWLTVGGTVPDALSDWRAAGEMRPNTAGFLTAPGMFSPDKVDAGSQLLAEVFAGELKGSVADLGAGWGWLSAQALASNPRIEAITLVEAERMALDAARQNVPDERAVFDWQDVRALPARRLYDAVICNPPFHKTRSAEPELGKAFISAAGRCLKTSGTLWLVANRQLPYEQALDASFQSWEELPGNGAFKLFRARRPRT